MTTVRKGRSKKKYGWLSVAAVSASFAVTGAVFAASSVGADHAKKASSSNARVADAERPEPEVVVPGAPDPLSPSPATGVKSARPSVVSASAKEIDQSKDMGFSPETDPYCQGQGHFVDIVKDAGYALDRQIRGAHAVTDEEEEKLGEEIFEDMQKTRGFRRNIDTASMSKDLEYIKAVVAPLLVQVERKGIHYDFHTVDDDEPNAFAIPGGHIFVNRGMLEGGRIENEAQLAGVLAHEINHVDRRHTVAVFEYLRRLGTFGERSGSLGETVVQIARHPFSSKDESESDEYAVKFLIAAEYSPKQFVTMWQNWDRLEKEEEKGRGRNRLGSELEQLLSTHPASSKRACDAMRVTNDSKDAGGDRYYVGTTNFKERRARSAVQY